ncbi:transporter substrate-binding domain-containing protein [Candidimonas sp. SYP-B2681]|uniref:transporter substrate-binding domain-containing protein n=1 Tax=Candidimonas sp. SYP-B2681 TaxID=2497686 RepID=UPI000F85D0B3|nr:transporter substrate-binding domain-containing protein [Candidimonas sp. SYP-B2681]RTZ45608.1 transporter substrate-binding domain-containing protein [Candidimonas sp. SYP-B2681]
MKHALAASLLCIPALVNAQTSVPNQSTLDKVIESKTLRICTPGDYRPFSYHNADGSYEGLDVDLMHSLAKTLGAKVEFVKTSWSNLMADFTSGKCDIGAGGISVSLERQKKAYFSSPYMVNGKTPITLCSNVEKFQSVADINKPEVRVIHNPGGSNETFAKTHLSKAKITLHENNIGIFNEVAEGRADVFVTEAAEAKVQSKRDPRLCAVNPDKPLQYAEMGYLLPSGDIRFKLFVDQWLHLGKASGEYAKLADKWVPQ